LKILRKQQTNGKYDFGSMRKVYMSQIRNSEIFKENVSSMGKPIKYLEKPTIKIV
jgi:hypothetical protein